MKNTKLVHSLLAIVFLFAFIFFGSSKGALAYCNEAVQGADNVIAGSCTFSKTVGGVDAPGANGTNIGRLIVSSGTLTVNSGQTIIFGSLLMTGGSMVIDTTPGSTAKLTPGAVLWMMDDDVDGYPGSLTEYTSASAAPGHVLRRKYLMTSTTWLDCSDIVYSAINSCCSQLTWYRDADLDGYGDPNDTTDLCAPAGYVANNTDCDPASATRYTNRTCYNDGDNDGYRTAATATSCAGVDCTSSATTYKREASASVDCDDTRSTVFVTHAACNWDMDLDGFTAGNVSGKTCLNTASCNTATLGSVGGGVVPTAYSVGQLKDVANGSDCKDIGTYANMVMYSGLTCYYDADNDNYGTATSRTCFNTQSCATATWGTTGAADDAGNINFASNTTDCGPNTNTAYPGSATCSTGTFLNVSGAASYDWNCSTGGGAGTACGTLLWTSPQYVGMGYRYDCSGKTCNPYAGRGYFTTMSPTHVQAGCGAAGFTSNPTGPGSCYNCLSCYRGTITCDGYYEGPLPSGAQTCN